MSIAASYSTTLESNDDPTKLQSNSTNRAVLDSLNLETESSSSSDSRTTHQRKRQEIKHAHVFKSRRLQSGHVLDTPFEERKGDREKWVTIIPLTGLVIGLLLAALLVTQGILTVQHHKYTLVLDEDWIMFDTNIWTKESSVGGFGQAEAGHTAGAKR